ncbi:rRNA biogenesis protein RRP36 [Emergomyces pasteurianus Ep9510]|uniref:rRNA biogenesis protein RRP36 n=1 Tax=Emergomyces pasteurianus Ep9510 TaxID=1447872 RepID=A0A1J9PNU9_9EURO|nr:rRNA biogenesis protein RRP36 [Emergomyces pasteurianus Ep9510]
MQISSKLNQRVRARLEEDEFEHFSDELTSDEALEGGESGEDEENVEDSEEEDGDNDEDEDEDEDAEDSAFDVNPSLSTISFGALAKAQESLGKRKRPAASKSDISAKRSKFPAPSPSPASPASSSSNEEEEQEQEHETEQHLSEFQKHLNANAKKPPQKLTHRSSKHAPTIQSSRHAVTRKRTIIEPPAVPKSRDPRFDSVVLNHSTNGNPSIATNAAIHASKNYAFLNSYRTDEIAQLRKQVSALQSKKHKTELDEREIVRLKRQITSMNDRQRTFERKEREREVLAQHRRKERELIREGKKSQPYFLKKGEVKREAVTKRFMEMSGKEKQRALERRRKKVAGKEKKEMPWGRRGVE